MVYNIENDRFIVISFLYKYDLIIYVNVYLIILSLLTFDFQYHPYDDDDDNIIYLIDLHYYYYY